jgi:hypothetical protein
MRGLARAREAADEHEHGVVETVAGDALPWCR